ncbi:glycosyltransferase family 4 protein [Pseudomonas sp. URMO17WK12:I12]|uniref:glycosyltransferase family 4 protein n=1 Tax=Pseudomonas sp. URMO17WK12:I12 TaxID=1259797 RepID=UPI00048822D2|nr:glycosyltransferase family 4 protein [Pseudomonas sp. URMO17WK12:I12]
MKILFPVLAFSSAGGMRVLSKIADEMIAQGHEVAFLAPVGSQAPYFPTTAPILKYQAYFQRLPILRTISKILGMYLALMKNRKSFDVIVANYNVTAIPVALATLGSKKGYYYIQAYEPEFYDELETIAARLSTVIAKFSYRLPLVQIVNAPMYRNYHEISTQYVVEPGIDLAVFKSREQHREGQELIIGCIGRKSKWKGTMEIIHAVQAVRTITGRDLKLRVAFELPDEINVSDCGFVEFCAPHGDQLLAEFYRACDVFVATGLIQDGAFHYPCIESMASGCLVISNYSPATAENAIYLADVNSEKITAALIEVLKMSSIQRYDLVEKSKADVEKLRWSVIASKMIDIFKVNGYGRS